MYIYIYIYIYHSGQLYAIVITLVKTKHPTIEKERVQPRRPTRIRF